MLKLEKSNQGFKIYNRERCCSPSRRRRMASDHHHARPSPAVPHRRQSTRRRSYNRARAHRRWHRRHQALRLLLRRRQVRRRRRGGGPQVRFLRLVLFAIDAGLLLGITLMVYVQVKKGWAGSFGVPRRPSLSPFTSRRWWLRLRGTIWSGLRWVVGRGCTRSGRRSVLPSSCTPNKTGITWSLATGMRWFVFYLAQTQLIWFRILVEIINSRRIGAPLIRIYLLI